MDPYSWIDKNENFSDYVKKLTKIEEDAISDIDYYVVAIYQGDYDRRLEYWTYDLGKIQDIDSFMEPFVNNPSIMTFPEMQKEGVPSGFHENEVRYGSPKVMKRFTLTEDTRKTMINAGWLFLDTMDLSMEPVLEIDKWQVDDHHILSIIYRIEQGEKRMPLNGACYSKAMENHKFTIYYQ